MKNIYYVYILASGKNGTLYTGVTNDLKKRLYQHKNNMIEEGFTSKYGIHQLAYYESTNDIRAALQREKQLKKWNRKWKIRLIKEMNPDWKDLSEEWHNGFPLARE